jgi:hypothetical protein
MEKPTVENQVDQLLREFDAWFQKKPNDPLIGSEKAILKTFCWFLIHEKERSPIPVVEEKEIPDGTQSSS